MTFAGHTGGVFPNVQPQRLDPTKEYVVVEYKYCEWCNNRFLREHAQLKTLPSGNIIDPNKYCPTCENKFAKEDAQATKEQIRDDPNYDSMPRGNTIREMHMRQLIMDKMQRECLRKEVLTYERAQKVSKAMRQRHRTKAPADVYKCKAHIDPILAETDPEEYAKRSCVHFHVGGRPDKP